MRIKRNEIEELARCASEKGYGNCVIFRYDGGYNMRYLMKNGTWTTNRAEAARCFDDYEADALAAKHGVIFFGGVCDTQPTCDVMSFRGPADFDKWLASNGSEIGGEE